MGGLKLIWLVLFFKPTRLAKVISEKPLSYDGPVVTDGYKSYDAVVSEAKIPHAYCWADVRREFLPLEGQDPTVKPILDLIDKLFAVEREATDFEELALLRIEKSAVPLTELNALLLLEHPSSRGEIQKRKAIEYALKRWTVSHCFYKTSASHSQITKLSARLGTPSLAEKTITALVIMSAAKLRQHFLL